MQKTLRFLIGITLFLLGALGISLLIFGYIYYREWTVALYHLIPFLLILLYLPFTLWLLITGIGVLAKRNWAWYSVQTLSLFLVLAGIILITVLNSLSFAGNLQFTWKQVKVVGTIGLLFFFIILPLFSLVLFSKEKEKEWGTGSRHQAEDGPTMYNLN